MSAFRDVLVVGSVLGIGYALFRKYGSKFDITSDQNVAYQAADSLAKDVFGPKGTVTDFVPGINTTTATTTTSSDALAKLSVLPTAAAPFWYDKDLNPRKEPMSRGGTVYSVYGTLMQITNYDTQAAARVADL